MAPPTIAVVESEGHAKSVNEIPKVGGVIKSLRQERGLSLAALAASADVSVGMLSQVERDKANPSLRVLTQIRQALGVPATALFLERSAPTTRDPTFVRRSDQHPRLDLGYFTKELLSPGAPHNLQIMIIHVPAHGSSGPQPMSYPAEKGGLVLEGGLVLRVGTEEALLQSGDSFVFNSAVPHSFSNPSDRPARVVWIIGPMPAERHL